MAENSCNSGGSCFLTNYLLIFSCLFGLGLSIYAYTVELQAHQDVNYKAMCDISEHVSCSKVFTSKYGRGMGGLVGYFLGDDSVLNKENSLVGILIYSLLATLAQSNAKFITQVSLFIIILCNLGSVYLAYVLFFILHDFCVVCVSLYVVNFVNLLLVYSKLCNISKLGVSVGTQMPNKTKIKSN